MIQPPNEPGPVLVDISKPPESELTGLSDVLLGALGLTGVMILAAVLLAIAMAAGLFWFRAKWGNPFPSSSQDSEEGRGRITR